jgi:hypothetical protein
MPRSAEIQWPCAAHRQLRNQTCAPTPRRERPPQLALPTLPLTPPAISHIEDAHTNLVVYTYRLRLIGHVPERSRTTYITESG